jgi:hypothetical protein
MVLRVNSDGEDSIGDFTTCRFVLLPSFARRFGASRQEFTKVSGRPRLAVRGRNKAVAWCAERLEKTVPAYESGPVQRFARQCLRARSRNPLERHSVWFLRGRTFLPQTLRV